MLLDCLFFILTTVFFYGIGINRAIILSQEKNGIILLYIKSLLASVSTVALSYFFIQILLVPIGLQELYPVICILIFTTIFVFFEVIVHLTSQTNVAELSISFFCCLLAISESISLLESVLFVLCCITSFYLLIPFLKVILNKNKTANPVSSMKNSLIIISLALLMCVLLVIDVSWLNGGISR